MRRLAAAALLLAACGGVRYRSPGDSDAVRAEIDDRNVASRVRMALAGDPETAPLRDVRVSCAAGVVTLTGVVARPGARRRAVLVASRCDGVARVVDRLTPTAGG